MLDFVNVWAFALLKGKTAQSFNAFEQVYSTSVYIIECKRQRSF